MRLKGPSFFLWETEGGGGGGLLGGWINGPPLKKLKNKRGGVGVERISEINKWKSSWCNLFCRRRVHPQKSHKNERSPKRLSTSGMIKMKGYIKFQVFLETTRKFTEVNRQISEGSLRAGHRANWLSHDFARLFPSSLCSSFYMKT